MFRGFRRVRRGFFGCIIFLVSIFCNPRLRRVGGFEGRISPPIRAGIVGFPRSSLPRSCLSQEEQARGGKVRL